MVHRDHTNIKQEHRKQRRNLLTKLKEVLKIKSPENPIVCNCGRNSCYVGEFINYILDTYHSGNINELSNNYNNKTPGNSIFYENQTELINPNDSIRDLMSFEDNLAFAAVEDTVDLYSQIGSKQDVLYEFGMHKTRIPSYKN